MDYLMYHFTDGYVMNINVLLRILKVSALGCALVLTTLNNCQAMEDAIKYKLINNSKIINVNNNIKNTNTTDVLDKATKINKTNENNKINGIDKINEINKIDETSKNI